MRYVCEDVFIVFTHHLKSPNADIQNKGTFVICLMNQSHNPPPTAACPATKKKNKKITYVKKQTIISNVFIQLYNTMVAKFYCNSICQIFHGKWIEHHQCVCEREGGVNGW